MPRQRLPDPVSTSARTPPAPFTPLEIGAVVAMAISVGCLPAVIPVLLGALLEAHRITGPELGHIATAEALGRVIASVSAGLFLKPVHLRRVAVLCGTVMAATSLAMIPASPALIMLARFANGMAAGLVLWMLVGLVALVSQPGRLFAVYVTVQAVVALVLSGAISGVLLPHWGPAGGYAVLALLGAAPLGCAVLMPGAFPLTDGAGGARLPTGRGLAGLFAAFLYLAGVFAIWVYLGPIARQLGYDPQTVTMAINAAIAMQIAGGACAVRLADRWNGALTTALAALVSAACVAALLVVHHPAVLYLAAGMISFVWMFVASFHLPMIQQCDPSGRSAIHTGTAQLGGIATGPLLAAALVAGPDMRGAGLASVLLFVGAALVLAVTLGPRRKVLKI